MAIVVSSLIFSCKSEKNSSEVPQEVLDRYKEKDDSKTEKKEATTTQEKTTFNLKPLQPVNGKLKGVVELGASGFNSFIINVDKDLNWEVKKKEFGASLIAEGMTDANAINSKLKEYIQGIIDYGVTPKDIHFVVSSGAAKEKITEIITKELKNIGYIVNAVTPEQEGVYALKSVLPSKFNNSAFVVDIGSGNTKISYLDISNSVVALETYGAKYYQKNIKDSIVYNGVKTTAAKIPSEKTSQCFIIGGVPYKLAKSVRNNKERYTVLSTNTEDFAKVAEDEGQKVKSGLNIYKAIQDEAAVKKVIFDWDANFTIGFLLSETK